MKDHSFGQLTQALVCVLIASIRSIGHVFGGRAVELFAPQGDSSAEFPSRIIIRSPNPLGDACMSIPAIRAIRASLPDHVELTILCRENLRPLWSRQPEIGEVIAIPGRQKPHVVAGLIRSQQQSYEAAILLPNSTSSALEMVMAGIPAVYGYAGHLRKIWLKGVVPAPPSEPPMHHLERYLRIAEHLGADVSDRDKLLLVSQPPQPIVASMREVRIGICPGAEYGEAKRWPLERFRDMIGLVREGLSGQEVTPVIVGSPAERGLGEQLEEWVDGPVENLAGKTTVGELVDKLKTCHLVISNDTGTMHLAAALGVPTVGIFGSTDPNLSSPVGDQHRIILEKADCSPCFKRDCPIDFRCMTSISPQQVAGEVLKMLV